MRIFLPFFLIMAGCTAEYDVTSATEVHGVNNPKEIETPVQTDNLVQRTVPEVDVLWCLDNSSSMTDEATKIVNNFPIFLEYFLGSGLDYHIGIISTNMERAGHRGMLQMAQGNKWIQPDTPNPDEVFAQMTPFYPGQSHQESGRDAIYAALALQTEANDGFLRDDASLHIVMISDEEDHSSAITIGEFVNYLEALKPDEEGRLSFNSIVGVEVPCDGSFERGTGYLDVTSQIGGIYWSICVQDWAPVVEALGLQAAGLQREFFLARQPVIGTIEVSVLTEGLTFEFAEDVDWFYTASRNSVTFVEYVPDALSQVQITYEDLSALEL